MNQSGGSETFYGGNPCKVIQDRISLVERHFGDICQGVGGYVRSLAKLRNKGDLIARAVLGYAQNETHNPTTQAALKDFAGHLSLMEDYRSTEVNRMEVKVVEPLASYGKSCKQAKERIRMAFAAHDREMKQRRALGRLMERNPHDSRQITQAQVELQKAAIDASKAHNDLEQEMDSFEKKKLEDIKKVMTDFVNIQLSFHSKALEFYSLCFQSLSGLREDTDLEEFRSSLRPMMSQTRQELQRRVIVSEPAVRSNRGPASNFVVSSASAKEKQKQDPGTRNSTLNSTNPSSMYSQTTTQDDDDDDDSEIDDDDEDDEDDDDDDDETEQPSHRGNQVQGKPQVTPRRR